MMPFPRMEFRIPRMKFRIPRLAPRMPRTLRELREWPFHSESVLPEIGVVPRLLTFRNQKKLSKSRLLVLLLSLSLLAIVFVNHVVGVVAGF